MDILCYQCKQFLECMKLLEDSSIKYYHFYEHEVIQPLYKHCNYMHKLIFKSKSVNDINTNSLIVYNFFMKKIKLYTIPCDECITLPMCIPKFQIKYLRSTFTLRKNCSLLNDYFGISSSHHRRFIRNNIIQFWNQY